MISYMVKALHLTASMKVARAHQKGRHVTVDDKIASSTTPLEA